MVPNLEINTCRNVNIEFIQNQELSLHQIQPGRIKLTKIKPHEKSQVGSYI